jgi:uncharacterized RDD family membrane protein YckC
MTADRRRRREDRRRSRRHVPAPLRAVTWAVLMLTLVAAGAASGVPAAPGPAAQPARPIRVHGNDVRFWIAQVYGVTGEQGLKDEAQIFRRDSGEDRWRVSGRLDSDVVAMGSRVTQLAMLVPDGSWLLLSDETATTGPPLPGGAKILTFGTDGSTLWAVGQLPQAPAGKGANSAPATTTTTTVPAASARSARTKPAAATTAATAPAAATAPVTALAPVTVSASVTATAPAGAATTQQASTASSTPPTLALFALQSYGWVRGADLPPGVEDGPALIALSFVDHEAIIAWRSEPHAVELSRLADGNWWPAGKVKTGGTISRLKLIGGTPRPVLWIAAGERESSLTWFGRGSEAVRVDLPVPADSRAEDLAVAFANGRVRVLAYIDGKLTERTFDPLTGAATGAPAPINLPRPANTTLTRWVEPLLVIALIYVIVASIRRREQMRDVSLNPTEFVLAPVGRRLIAGTIDALPVIVGGAVSWWQFTRTNEIPTGESWLAVPENMAPAQVALFGGGCALYLLHTALGEVWAGRSIGKACCGLRVVGLDGRPAAAGAVIIRNLLRIVDLAMVFFPLVLILFSPLRQRAGDVAAGTLVVLNGRTQPVDPDTAAEQSAGMSPTSSSAPTKADH